MTRIYVYPNIKLGIKGFTNPYIKHLAESLSANNQVVNKDFPASNGIFDILKYLKQIDLLYLNWIEDLPEKRGGYIQSLFFILLLPYLKLRGKKIVWTLHNKKSHSEKYKLIKSVLFKLLLKYSDLVVTHAKEGLNHIPATTSKVYIHHPLKVSKQNYAASDLKKYDLIIWGSITKYKGIDAFLDYLTAKGLIENYEILIAGEVVGSELRNTLEKLDHEYQNFTLMNAFVEEKELEKLIFQSRVVLFCYHSDTVLSSGALMDSLLYNSAIVGPDVGSFNDLAREGIIHTFKSYDDLILILNELIEDPENLAKTKDKRMAFIENNSWEAFSSQIDQQLSLLLPDSKKA